MPETNPSDLMKSIRAGDVRNVYYIYGKDVLTVENTTKALFKKLLGNNYYDDILKFDGSELDISELTDSMDICPMFSDKKGILVNDLDAEQLTADKLVMLLDSIENIPDFTILVVNITGIDIKKGKKVFSGKNKKLTDLIAKKGIVCECPVKTPALLEKSVMEAVKKNGCEISRRNAAKLCEYCIMDTMQISNEIEKLCSYRISGEITSYDIDSLVSGQIETDAFKLARAVIAMDGEKSFYYLDSLLNRRSEPVAVVSAITMSFLDLYRAKIALTANKRSKEIAEDFNYKGRSFAVDNALRDCRRISAENLRRCMNILCDADRTLKSSSFSQKTVLEKMLTQMLMAVRGQ